MSHFRVLTVLDGVARSVAGRAVRTVGALRSQAPGARMIGEFAVRTGVDQLRRRIMGDPGGRRDATGPNGS